MLRGKGGLSALRLRRRRLCGEGRNCGVAMEVARPFPGAVAGELGVVADQRRVVELARVLA